MINQIINEIIRCLEEENEVRESDESENLIDIPYYLSVLEQKLNNVRYSNFIEYVGSNEHTTTFIPKEYGEFELKFQFYNSNIRYMVEFDTVHNSDNYCQCTKEGEGYDSRYNCCGYDCDWDAPSFSITKEELLGRSCFEGLERDLWEYKDKYNNVTLIEKEQIEKAIALKKLMKEKEYIEKQIKELME